MKKLLSIILACAMIMSLFCVVPASATMKGSTYHYVFEDFEDGVSSVTAGKGSLSVVDADNGSLKALKYTFSSETDYADLSIPDRFGMKANFTEDMTLRASVRYKLGKPLSKGDITLLTVNSGDANFYSVYKITNLTDTENWYTAEFEISTFKVNTDSVMFQLRVGNSGSQGTVAADGGDVEIYLDDLQITKEKNTNRDKFTMCSASPFEIHGSASLVDDPLNSNNRVLRITPAANKTNNVNLYNVWYFKDKDPDVTYKIGDTITVSCDVLVEGMWYDHNLNIRSYPRATDKGEDADAYISAVGSSYYTKTYQGSKRGEWQTLTWTFEVTKLANGKYQPYIYLSDNVDTDKEDDGRVDMGHYTYYFDNLTVTVSDRSDYIIPSATGLTATMAEDGTVTPAYTYAETAVAGVEAGTDVSLLKVKRANGAVVASTVAGEALVVPEAYRNESLTLEVLPVSSTGTFGDAVVTAAITSGSAVEPIVGITLTQASGSVTVATDTALTAAKLVFVTYDANGKMVDWEAVDVTLDAQASQAYAPVDLTAGTYTKAMLWFDMAECKPLADMIQY